MDLIKRLRSLAAIGWNPIGDEAADRIEKLEADLQRFRVLRIEDRKIYRTDITELTKENTILKDLVERKQLRLDRSRPVLEAAYRFAHSGLENMPTNGLKLINEVRQWREE